MKKISGFLKYDLLKDNPVKILICLALPLFVVNIISIFTTTINNNISSKYIGQIIFSISGLLSSVTLTMTQLVSGIPSASWIKTAGHYSKEHIETTGKYYINSIYAITIIEIICIALFWIGADVIFSVINIPDSIYSQVMLYYKVFLISTFFTSVSTLITTIATGVGSVMDLFIRNLITLISGIAVNYIVLAVFKLGIAGAVLSGIINSLVTILVCHLIIHKNGIKIKLTKRNLTPDFKFVFSLIRYGMLISLQTLLCSVGNLTVSLQTNKYLSLDYISVIPIILPINAPMNSLMLAGNIFVPPNYSAGNSDRIKKYLKIALTACIGYSIISFIIFFFTGEAYFSTLFDDANIISLGKFYWRWYGFSTILVSVMCVIRPFYDCIGLAKVSLFSGLCEMIGYFISAFLIIPNFGNIGHAAATTFGYTIATVYLVSMYYILRRRIYERCDEQKYHKKIEE